jgi:hypothetical protein
MGFSMSLRSFGLLRQQIYGSRLGFFRSLRLHEGGRVISELDYASPMSAHLRIHTVNDARNFGTVHLTRSRPNYSA